MSDWLFVAWVSGSVAAGGWYSYDCSAGRAKLDGGAFWLVLALGPIAVAVMIGEALGRRHKRDAQAIEVQRAETENTGSVHESAVGETDAPKG